jgi:pSer/pThr/pTyr-binding forkhead associated (FHA) protein
MLIALAVLAVAVLAAVLWWLFLRPRPICKLTLREGDGVGLEFLITDRAATIGSEEGQTVTVSHPRVSRQHAVLNLEDGQFVLRDRSKQGTRVNGQQVSEAVLRSGDLISLGDSIDLIFTRLGS